MSERAFSLCWACHTQAECVSAETCYAPNKPVTLPASPVPTVTGDLAESTRHAIALALGVGTTRDEILRGIRQLIERCNKAESGLGVPSTPVETSEPIKIRRNLRWIQGRWREWLASKVGRRVFPSGQVNVAQEHVAKLFAAFCIEQLSDEQNNS